MSKLNLTKRKSIAYLLAFLIVITQIIVMTPVSTVKAADISSSYTWKPVKIGGGGWVTNVVVHPKVDNVIYCRADVGGFYKWDETSKKWTQMVTASRMPSGVVNAPDGSYGPGVARTMAYGCDGLAIDPNNSNVVYAALGNAMDSNGFLVKSTNGGSSFSLLSLAVPFEGNGELRTSERIQVDPSSSKVVLVGTRKNGLYRSADNGANFSQISTSQVPVGTTNSDGKYIGITAIQFDPKAGTDSNGFTKRIYVSVYGAGIYKSEDSGSSFSKIYNTYAEDMQVVDGVMYAAIYGTGVIKYTPGSSVSTYTPAGQTNYVDIAVKPSNKNVVYAVNDGCQNFVRTTDGGSNWTELSTDSSGGQSNFKSTNIPWVANSSVRNWLSIGEIVIDPRNESRMWFSEGMGMWRSTDISDTNTAPTFNNISEGIEEMVATDVATSPSGKVTVSTWDRQGFHYNGNLDSYPSNQFGLTSNFASGMSLSTSSGDTNFMVAAVENHNNSDERYSGYSTDGGDSWTKFGSITGGSQPSELAFGEIVVSPTNTQNLVWHPRNFTSAVYYSTNRGGSWTKSSFNSFDCNGGYYMSSTRILAADGATGGKFYVYDWNAAKIKISTDNGANFKTDGASLPGWAFWCQLKSVPGKANRLYFTPGYDMRSSDSDRGLYYSSTGGTSFTKVANVQDCWAFGFGKAATTGGDPTIFMYGKINNKWGIYRSTDNAATWDFCVEYPCGLFDKVQVVQGDVNEFGKVYIGYAGNSFVYGTTGSSPTPTPTSTTSPTPTPSATPTPTPTSTPSSGIVSGQTYKLTCKASGKVLDNGWSSSDDTTVIQHSDYGSDSQKWTVTDVGGGYYKIICTASGKALDNGWSSSNGSNIIQYSYYDADSQKWQITSVGGGYYKVINKASGKSLDNAWSTSEDSAIVQWDYNGGDPQLWSFQ